MEGRRLFSQHFDPLDQVLTALAPSSGTTTTLQSNDKHHELRLDDYLHGFISNVLVFRQRNRREDLSEKGPL